MKALLTLSIFMLLSGCTVLINSDHNQIQRTADVMDPVIDILSE